MTSVLWGLLALLGGYVLARDAFCFKYRIARTTGYRFYFQIALCAFYLSTAAALLVLLYDSCVAACSSLFANPSSIGWKFQTINDLELWLADNRSAIAFGALLLGVPTAWVLNRLPWTNAEQSLLKVIENRDFDLLIYKATSEDKLVMLTLASRQFYLGFLIRGPDPETDDPWIRLLPLASGYRRQKDFRLEFTNYYAATLQTIFDRNELALPDAEFLTELALDDFEIVFPRDAIRSARLFDPIAYDYFVPGNDLTAQFQESQDDSGTSKDDSKSQSPA